MVPTASDTASATIPATPDRADFEGRRAYGRARRIGTPRTSHAVWETPADRADPIALLEEQAESRVPELVPIRHGRMMVSPFTFYRGAALLMAADLARTPKSGLTVQLCGDAHLSNFGLFGSPERRLLFDINDFDETHPGPFEWDLKRLVASFEIAGRHRGFTDEERQQLRLAAARGYRERMIEAAESSVLDAWYDHLDAEQVESWVKAERAASRADKRQVKAVETIVAKARTKDRLRAFSKLVTNDDGEMRIIADPPLIVPVEDVVTDAHEIRNTEATMRGILASYRSTLLVARHPLAEYRYVHMARKVVGVGSVGTRAWIVLLTGRDASDPLFLQAKEARASVLERFLEPSEYASHGERVVRGQRRMQASTDIFLGWRRVRGDGGIERDFYVRQLHDWKGSFDPEVMIPRGALLYARICGETLARAHARSGDRVEIAAYLGRSARFDEAISEFSVAYADQNDADYASFIAAIASGRLEAREGL
ncbi:DUF2252 domain-containing protein [Microbacterium pygmaeum]|uniref:Uncharacterized conserved protein, DUF2252 family n=1 Tax=Microbacterium pygmaeum TaxID=370764 RepID=A0A1G7VS08_9MICO|nr:DUF2252 domain-containing protein [Microbacterium pygmaeum]SDG62595.1 Uncharacterized conserved protein, DUF2252 family [Microbacterium pygmaeum]